MKSIKRGEILSNLGSKTYARGKDYYEQGRVVSLEIEFETPYTAQLASAVKGSGAKVYRQEITLEGDGDYLEIFGTCTCPVRYDCKHVVAACLQYQHRILTASQTEQLEEDCFTWLDEFTRSTMRESAPAPGNEFIIYLLKPSAHAGTLNVELSITRWLKKGGLGKRRSTNLYNIAESYHPANYLRPLDIEIAKLLKADRGFNWHDVSLQGELGFLALGKMIETGRCYWHDTDGEPLQAGAERELSVHWQQDEQGTARLELRVLPEGMLLLTEPALYLDPAAGTVGSLSNAPYTAAQLEQLLEAPSIPAQQISRFSQQVVQTVTEALLPPPQAVDIEEITELPPLPRLLLSSRQIGKQLNHLIRLRFAYGDYEIPVLPEAEMHTLSNGEKLVRIQREQVKETSFVEQLKALGFEPLIDQNNEDLVFRSYASQESMESVDLWNRFLTDSLPELQQQGWQVEYDSGFGMQFHQAGPWQADIEEQGNDWFGLRFDVEIGDQPVALLPLVAQLLDHYEPQQLPETLNLNLGGSHYLTIASEQIRPILETLYELYDRESLQADGSLLMSRFDAGRLTELEEHSSTDLHWRGGEALRKLGRQLKDFQGIATVKPPKGLHASLRDYQQQGLNWLQFLRQYGFSGILADDMGLGKTVQTLAHLLLEKEQGRMDKPCLIIAPTSLMSNWRREAEQFAPALKVLVLQGPARQQHFEQITNHDLVLSTYPLLSRDKEQLLAHRYHTLVLDEAQVVKNPQAQAAKVVRQIDAEHRLCLSGTPMENHLGELWALFDFLMPGFLGDKRQFNTLFRTPIEKHGDGERRQRLVKRVAPFMLRRSKQEVAKELPEKSEINLTVSLAKKQAALYETIRLSMEDKVRKAIANKGLARSHITILDALLKLRQVCCDPRLLSLTQAREVKESAKFELLMQMLPEMVEEGRRILLFSQFTKMLGFIEEELVKQDISYSKLTGQTRNRDEAIERFKSGAVNVFLISLKAGGVGLNLTEADTVIHYDPWWNPAAENQATDRAHRIGQKKPVFVYKLVTENSVEEKIIAMQARKQQLADGIYNEGKADQGVKLAAEDLEQLFAPL